MITPLERRIVDAVIARHRADPHPPGTGDLPVRVPMLTLGGSGADPFVGLAGVGVVDGQFAFAFDGTFDPRPGNDNLSDYHTQYLGYPGSS